MEVSNHGLSIRILGLFNRFGQEIVDCRLQGLLTMTINDDLILNCTNRPIVDAKRCLHLLGFVTVAVADENFERRRIGLGTANVEVGLRYDHHPGKILQSGTKIKEHRVERADHRIGANQGKEELSVCRNRRSEGRRIGSGGALFTGACAFFGQSIFGFCIPCRFASVTGATRSRSEKKQASQEQRKTTHKEC